MTQEELLNLDTADFRSAIIRAIDEHGNLAAACRANNWPDYNTIYGRLQASGARCPIKGVRSRVENVP